MNGFEYENDFADDEDDDGGDVLDGDSDDLALPSPPPGRRFRP